MRASKFGNLGAIVCAGAAGFFGVGAQAYVLREMLVLVSGFEPALGAVLGSWLLWCGAGSLAGAAWARSGSHCGARAELRLRVGAAWLLGVLGAGCVGGVLLLRGWRLLCHVPSGVFPSFFQMAGGAFLAPAVAAAAGGALFAVCWRWAELSGERPLTIYISEAVGAALGGAGVFMFLSIGAPTVWACVAFAGGALMLAGAGAYFAGSVFGRRMAAGCLALALAALFVGGALERASLHWMWGRDARVVGVMDTPLQNLVIVKQNELISLFSGGAWAYSAPDPETVENAVHLPLVFVPRPRRVLVLGGDGPAQARELFAHGVTNVEYVAPDPGESRFYRIFAPDSWRGISEDVRYVSHAQDAGAFLLQTGARYDAVLMNLAPPLSLSANRFHSKSFYEQVATALTPDGVFSFALPASPEAVGPVQARSLRDAFATLESVFARVVLLPGASARFLAFARDRRVEVSAAGVLRRLEERGVDAAYLTPSLLLDRMNPFRMEYFSAMLRQAPGEVNHVFTPRSYTGALLQWSQAAGVQVSGAVEALLRLDWRAPAFLAGIAGVGLGALCFGRGGAGGRRRLLLLAVAVTGGGMLALEAAFVLGFQVLCGAAYGWLAVLTAGYMAGVGLGSALVSRRPPRAPWRWLVGVQGVMCLALCGAYPVFSVLHLGRELLPGTDALGVLFVLLSTGSGLLGGAHFSLAALYLQQHKGRAEGARLYAFDVLGAAGGVMGVMLGVVPLYGLPAGLATAGALCFGSWVWLASRSEAC